MKIAVIVPVHPREPLHIVRSSYRSLRKLNFDGYLSITYIIDSDESDKKVRWLQGRKAKVLARNSRKGGKAGAINYALRNLNDADWIAFFDIDSRPDQDFLQECLKALKADDQRNAFMASGIRYATNRDENFVTKLASVQHELMSDIQRVTNYFGWFTGFNGLIGIICSADLEKLDESAICEDTDFLLRMWAKGKRAVLSFPKSDGSRTMVGEQVPSTIRNFVRQQTRWMKGGFEALKLLRKRNNIGLVLSVISILFPLIWLPLIPAYYVELAKKHKPFRAFKNLGICLLIPFIQFSCSSIACWRLLAGKEIKWKPPKRSKEILKKN